MSPETRLECLKLAVQFRDLGTKVDQVISRAKELEAYVMNAEADVISPQAAALALQKSVRFGPARKVKGK